MFPRLAALALLLIATRPAAADPVALAETPKPGDASRYTVGLIVTGHLVVLQEGAKQEIKLDARARHRFAERTLAVADGLAERSARAYDEAAADATVGGDTSTRALPADRRRVVARRTADGPFCYSTGGPLTRDELELVTDHFDPQCLPGLLPGKAVGVGDTWAVTDPAARAAGRFDGLVKNALTGKLVAVADGRATFAVGGTAEGIESGARVALAVAATGTFDLASGRVVGLVWKQTDDRDQGAVNPASKVEATITLTREPLADVPADLTDAALGGKAAGDPPAALTRLHYADPRGRYRIVYPRDWHVTGRTDAHLVLRLLDRGEFVAQATVTGWTPAAPGRHATPDEFKKAVAASPGWVPTRVLDDAEVPAGGGRWLYRVTAEGKMGGLPVVQGFHLLAGPGGEQVVVTVAAKPEKAKALAGRDLGLVEGVEFGRK